MSSDVSYDFLVLVLNIFLIHFRRVSDFIIVGEIGIVYVDIQPTSEE